MPAIPKDAKKPQDHAAKAEAAKAEALGETVTLEHNGIEYVVELALFDDVETFALLGKMQVAPKKERTLYIPLIVERMLGDDQFAKFLAGNRDKETGRVPLEVLGDLFNMLDATAGNA